MDPEGTGRRCKTAPATPVRRSSSASHQKQMEEHQQQHLAPKAPWWPANRVTRSRSTSALTCLSLASKASLQSASTATTTTPSRRILASAKSELSQPALDTHLTKASELSPPPTAVSRSRSSSSATALSDLLDAAVSPANPASTPKRFTMPSSLTILSPSLSSSKSSPSTVSQPQTPSSPHRPSGLPDKHTASPPSTPSNTTHRSQAPQVPYLALPMKRSRSSTISSYSDHPRKSPPPKPLRHVTSHSMLSLNSLYFNKSTLPPPLATSLPSRPRGPTSPLKSAFKPDAQSGGSGSPDSSSTVKPGCAIQVVSAPVTPLTPTHLPFIDRITVSYFAAATCAAECKKLVLSFRRLSAPLPLTTQCINTARTVKIVAQLRENGPNKIEVLYRDGYRLCFDPEEMLLDQMLSRIRTHAEEMASAFAHPSH